MANILGNGTNKANPDEDNKGEAQKNDGPTGQGGGTTIDSNTAGIEGEGAGGGYEDSSTTSSVLDKYRDLLPPTEEELEARLNGDGEYATGIPEPIAAFKHRAVRHFKVGPYEFKNHILYLHEEKSLAGFLEAYRGLPERDRNEIVQYDWRAAAQVETPVNVARGGLSTSRIKDSKRIA